MSGDYIYSLGSLERQVAEHERRLNAINGHMADVRDELGEIKSDLTRVMVKVGIAAGIGGAITGPLTGIVVYLLQQ